MKNIVETAIDVGLFDTLLTAIGIAGLEEMLSSVGPFTVFAPTDEAFAKIPKETLEAVLADKDRLIAILTYHVIPGKVIDFSVVGITSAKTVQGSEVKVNMSDGFMINGTKVIKNDIECSNGVIHVIDTVLMPAYFSGVNYFKSLLP